MSRASRAVASPHVVSTGDFRPLARLRLPRPVFDYLDGGADGEVTLRENCRVFDDVMFRPRYAVPLPDCDLRTRVLGFEVSFPAILAPVGYSRLMHPDGENGRGAGGGQSGHGLHSFDHLRPPGGRRQGGFHRSGLLSAVLDGRPRGLRSRDRTGPGRGLRRPRGHHRHAGSRNARARLPQWHERTDGRQPAVQDSISSPNAGASRMACQLPARRRSVQAAERSHPRKGSDGAG